MSNVREQPLLSGDVRSGRPVRGAPLVVHLGILAVGLVAYTVFAARTWFFYDDWYFLVQHPDVIWSPHVGHWSTVPALVFLGLQAVFGVDHYLPFAVPAIIAHLAVVHFVWRLSIRSGVRPWIATAFSVLLVFLGAGAEALAWAVQIGFVGAVAWILGAILLLDRTRLTVLTGVSASALVLISVASSGVALPFVACAAVLGWLRHGILRTLAIFLVPIGAYATWFLLERGATPVAGAGATVGNVAQFAVAMLSDGLGRMFPFAILGALTFIALSVWWIFTVGQARTRGLPAYVLFPAAPLFAALTGLARTENGISTASSSRYVYVVVIAIAPFLAVCFDRAT